MLYCFLQFRDLCVVYIVLCNFISLKALTRNKLRIIQGTVMQIEKALINDRLRVSKVS